MAIFELYSKRQKKLHDGVPEVYDFDHIPKSLKVQIIHIWDDAIGIDDNYSTVEEETYEELHKLLCREYGVFNLVGRNHSAKTDIVSFFLNTDNHKTALDIIELTFKFIDIVVREEPHKYLNAKMKPDHAIEELNGRFKEAAIGYSFENNEIIKVDSTLMHNEITKPTIALTWNRKFEGANDEYMKAHDHYKHGRNKECLSECLKAFESTLKTICQEKDWEFASNATARTLIQICFNNELIPTFTQNQFTSLRSLLESGIPSIRNKLGGHGQGQVPQKVDDEMTRYALNLTGTNIIFLIEQSGL